jgi:hypothetical protein
LANDDKKHKERQNSTIKKQAPQDTHQRSIERSKSNRRRKMRNLNTIFATVALIVLLLSCYSVWQYYEGQKPPTIGGVAGGSMSSKKAPDFSLIDINGTQASLSQLKGKVIGIHFMAVGCSGQINPINNYQLSQLNSACNSLCKKDDAAFLTVAVATCENSNLDALRSSYGVSWIMGNDYADGVLNVVNSYVPFEIGDGAIVLIDKNFNIEQIYNGGVSADTLVSKITQLSGA